MEIVATNHEDVTFDDPIRVHDVEFRRADAPYRPRRRRPASPPARPLRSLADRRVALFTGNFVNVVDGVSRTLNRLVSFLEKRGCQVLVVGPASTNGAVRDPAGFLPVPSLPFPGRPEYRLALGLPAAIRRRLDKFAPDLVHIATPDLLGFAALRWARARRLPVVATYHTHFPAYLRFYNLNVLKSPVRQYIRWFYGRCRHVYVPTPPLVEYFADLGIRESVRLWGRGVDTEMFSPRWRSESWRRERGVADDEVLVTFVGRLVREKGVDVYADVVDAMRRDGVAVRSMIVGDGPMRADLAARLKDAIFTGYVEGHELARAYASSDVFLFPSDSEAFGNVIVEAMAAGLPVVCAGSSGSSAHVVVGKTGLTAPPGDVAAFRAHTEHLVRSRYERVQMGREARLHAMQYDWMQTLRTMVEYYEEVWGTHAGGAGGVVMPD